MGQRSGFERLVYILHTLNDGTPVCVSGIAEQFEVSPRTARRDFELIREHFGNFISKEGDCYRAYRTFLLGDVLEGRDLMTLANIVNLFGLASMETAISEHTRALVAQSSSVYDFKSRPFEQFENREAIKRIEHCIKFSKEMALLYRINRGAISRIFHPYRILFLNENFYVVGMNIGKPDFEFLRISMILTAEETGKTFFRDRDVVDFVAKIQTPFASFGRQETVVRLLITRKYRKYFELKKYLPSQRIVAEHEGGDIEVHFNVYGLREIEELIIKWLPGVQVLYPKVLNDRIKRELQKKLAGLERPDVNAKRS